MRIGLATKITVPFVALFAALLALLGVALGGRIGDEVEAQVVREQRFVLSVTAFSNLPLDKTFLQRVRDKAGGGEFVVLESNAAPVVTFEMKTPADEHILDELLLAARDKTVFPGLGESDSGENVFEVRRELAGDKFLVLYLSRWNKGTRRDFFLLYPQRSIDEARSRSLQGLALIGGLGLLLAALLGRIVAHFISRPVRVLAVEAAQLSAAGLSGAEVKTLSALAQGGDEIAELSRAFQSMVENLRRSQDELLRAERLVAVGKLAAGVAHEIRNPLTSMRMTAEMLAKKEQDPMRLEAVRILLAEMDRMALAVEELLTVARPRPAQRVAVNLNGLVTDTMAFLERQFKHAKVEMRFEPDVAMPAEVSLDANKVKQALVNLLLNALQAIVREGTVTVRTRWDATAKAAVLEVSDTGPGIPEEHREKIFDLFYSTKAGGAGLGLAIVKQVTQEHGGSVSFESTPQGAVFRAVFSV